MYHDGQAFELPWLVSGGRLLPLDDIVSEWRLWQELDRDGELEREEPVVADRGVADRVWTPGWIPFADRDGDQLCLDLSPTSEGANGQVITCGTRCRSANASPAISLNG